MNNKPVIKNHTKIYKPEVVIIEGLLLHNILSNAYLILNENDFKELNLQKKEVKTFCENIIKSSKNIFIKAKLCEKEDQEERLNRRIERDLIDRNISKKETISNWKHLLKSHIEYVQPQEKLCEMIVIETTFNSSVEDLSLSIISSL